MKKKKSIVVFLLLLLLLLILTSCSKNKSTLNISQNQGDFLKTKPETITSKYNIKYSGDFFIRLHFYLKKGKVDWEVKNSKGDIVLRGYVINENGTTYRQLTYPLNFSEELKRKKAVKPTSDTTVEIFNAEDKVDEEMRPFYLSNLNYQSMNQIIGEVGYHGKVKGKVVKIGWNDAIDEKLHLIDENTILVVPQTTPAYVAILSRCKGLIVDEGGVIGHASIVSREMEIPSIIGTKYATKVFSDGDLVEIDTNRKIVRKLLLKEG